MNALKRGLLLTFLLLAFRVHAQGPSDLKALYQRVAPTVVTIELVGPPLEAKGGLGEQTYTTGTGFIAGENLVVTTLHLFELPTETRVRAKDIRARVTFWGGSSRFCEEAFYANVERDVAILKCPTEGRTSLHIATALPEIGENLVVVGNPLGLERSLSTGIVAAIRVYREIELIQLSAPVSPGSSGSPVIDEKGLVVGVIRGSAPEGQNLNFASSLIPLVDHLKEAPEFVMPVGIVISVLRMEQRRSDFEEAYKALSASISAALGKRTADDLEHSLDLFRRAIEARERYFKDPDLGNTVAVYVAHADLVQELTAFIALTAIVEPMREGQTLVGRFRRVSSGVSDDMLPIRWELEKKLGIDLW